MFTDVTIPTNIYNSMRDAFQKAYTLALRDTEKSYAVKFSIERKEFSVWAVDTTVAPTRNTEGETFIILMVYGFRFYDHLASWTYDDFKLRCQDMKMPYGADDTLWRRKLYAEPTLKAFLAECREEAILSKIEEHDCHIDITRAYTLIAEYICAAST